MRRLRNPVIKEVSLALNPKNKKKFIFLKEEIMNEDLVEINKKLNSILEIEDKEDFEKAANPLTVVSKKIDKLIEKKGEDKKTIQGILDSIKKIVDYLKQAKSNSYGYPAVKKDLSPGLAKGQIDAIIKYLKDNNAPKDVLDSAQKISDYLGGNSVKKDEEEITYTLDEVKEILKEANNSNE